MEIKARCVRRDISLGAEEFLGFHCGDWQPQDPNLIILMLNIDEVREALTEHARCWNCRWSLLSIYFTPISEEIGGEEEVPVSEESEG